MGQGHFVTSHLGDNMASVPWATKVSTKRIWDSLPKPILPNSAKCPYLAHFVEFFFGKVGIEIQQSGHRNSAKRARQLSTSAKTLFGRENIMWGISDVCTLALTVVKTSSHYDRFAIFVPARSLLLFDLA